MMKDMSKRPVAFRVLNHGNWYATVDEKEAYDIAEANNVDYEGLYTRKQLIDSNLIIKLAK